MESERPGQRAVVSVIGSHGKLSPLIPNPRYEPRLPEGLEVESARRLLNRPDLLAHWGPRARGVGLERERGDFFRGRIEALRALVGWIGESTKGRSSRRDRTPWFREVGAPRKSDRSGGCGLPRRPRHGGCPGGDLAAPSDRSMSPFMREASPSRMSPARSPMRYSSDAAVPLVLEAAAARERPPVVVVDALDEALDPRGLARELLRPMASSRTVKLVVGTREHVIPALGAEEREILDLDTAPWLGPTDVEDYVDHVLESSSLSGTPSPYATDARSAATGRAPSRRARPVDVPHRSSRSRARWPTAQSPSM